MKTISGDVFDFFASSGPCKRELTKLKVSDSLKHGASTAKQAAREAGISSVWTQTIINRDINLYKMLNANKKKARLT